MGSARVALRAGSIVTTLSVLIGASLAQNAGTLERMKRQALDNLLGTMSVQAEPSFTAGEFVGCLMVFDVLAKDFIYKQGGYIKVGGSFGFRSVKGTLGVTLKVVLHDLDPQTMNGIPSPPASAYFVSGNKTTKSSVVGSYPSDIPGAIVVLLQLQPNVSILTDGLMHDKVTIAFAREPGGADVQLAIDTSVAATTADGQRTHSLKPRADFAACSTELFESVHSTASTTRP